MKIFKRIVFLLIFLLTLLTISYANGARKPGITIFANNAPSDLTISTNIKNSYGESEYFEKVKSKFGMDYYLGYSLIYDKNNIQFKFASSDKSFDISVEDKISYRSIAVLDFEKQKLNFFSRTTVAAILTSFNLTLTLLIEGLVFYIFGYRKKESWHIFIKTNLITQLLLNLFLFSSPNDYLLMIGFPIAEIIIFIAEGIFMSRNIMEKRKSTTKIYVFTANLLSLILSIVLFPTFFI